MALTFNLVKTTGRWVLIGPMLVLIIIVVSLVRLAYAVEILFNWCGRDSA